MLVPAPDCDVLPIVNVMFQVPGMYSINAPYNNISPYLKSPKDGLYPQVVQLFPHEPRDH